MNDAPLAQVAQGGTAPSGDAADTGFMQTPVGPEQDYRTLARDAAVRLSLDGTPGASGTEFARTAAGVGAESGRASPSQAANR